MMNTTGEFAIATLSRSGIQPSVPNMVRSRPTRDMLTTEPRSLPFELHFADGQRLRIDLLGSGYEPASFWYVLTRVKHLSKLTGGWDSYGAQPLSARAVRRALELLPLLLQDKAPEPTVVPTRDGGLQFEWHRGGIDFEVTCRPTGAVSCYYADVKTGEEHEWDDSVGRQAIHNVLGSLAQVA